MILDQSSRKGWQVTGWNVKDLFVLGILRRMLLLRSPQESSALWTGHGAVNLTVDSHTVESLPDFRCTILVRLIKG